MTMSTAASFLGVSIFVVFSCLALPYGTAFDSRLRYQFLNNLQPKSDNVRNANRGWTAREYADQ